MIVQMFHELAVIYEVKINSERYTGIEARPERKHLY
jgi:hypothetical protein